MLACVKQNSFSLAWFIPLFFLLSPTFANHCIASGEMSSNIYGDIFNNSANWGGTGLLEIPTARVLSDGQMRLSYSYTYPYRWHSIGLGVLPRFEFIGTLTGLVNKTAFEDQGGSYGEAKDKAFHAKYQIITESERFPALTVGLQDFQGTGLFASRYIVLTKQFSPLDLPLDMTVGYGFNRLNGLFGGIEIALCSRLHLITEYNPINYSEDKGAAGESIRSAMQNSGDKFNLNFSARIKLAKALSLTLSHQRGDTLGFAGVFQFGLGNPIVPWKSDPPRLVPGDQRAFRERKPELIMETIQKEVYRAGFSNVKVYTDGMDIVVAFENDRYLSHRKAMGRVLRIVLAEAPEDTRYIVAILKKANLPVMQLSVAPKDIANYLSGRIDENTFLQSMQVQQARKTPDQNEKAGYLAHTQNQPGEGFRFGIKPGVEPFLNDPSGFFKVRLSVNPWLQEALWNGAYAYARLKVPMYSDVSTSNQIPEDAVRSDAPEYKGRGATFDRLTFNQIVRLTPQTYGKISLGYLELMYSGVSTEVLTFLGDGHLALGLEGNWAIKRKSASLLGLESREAYTCLGNLYWTISRPDVTLHAQYGRFLAGDVGLMFQASRTYDSGATVGGWLSFTNTDNIPGDFNKGYQEKGVFLKLPTRMFLDQDSPRKYDYQIAPWTRDVAQNVGLDTTLFEFTKGMMPFEFKNNPTELRQ